MKPIQLFYCSAIRWFFKVRYRKRTNAWSWSRSKNYTYGLSWNRVVKNMNMQVLRFPIKIPSDKFFRK